MDVIIFIAFIALCVYFAPSFVAMSRNHNNATSIGMLNLFLGWTFLGWVIALVWACSKDTAEPEKTK